MKLAKTATALIALTLLCAAAFAQEDLNPAKLLQQPTDTWPTYNGDYSGRRYSPLNKINVSSVKSLAPAWNYQIESGGGLSGRIASTPLEVNGVLYFTVPNRVWAIDARTGRELWKYSWDSKISDIGHRGVGIFGTLLYFE